MNVMKFQKLLGIVLLSIVSIAAWWGINLGHKEITGLVCYAYPCFQIVHKTLSRVDRFLLSVLFSLCESSMVSF